MDEAGATTKLRHSALYLREQHGGNGVMAEVRATNGRWQRCNGDYKHGGGEGMAGPCADRKKPLRPHEAT